MKSSWGSSSTNKERGLLGPLPIPGDRSGAFSQPRHEVGSFGGQASMP